MTLHQKFDVQTGTDREAETLVAGRGTRLDQLMKAWESKNASTARRMAGLGLLAVPLAACGGSGSGGGEEGVTRTLTVDADLTNEVYDEDNLVGTGESDIFIAPDGTLTDDDFLDGLGGIDVLQMSSAEADRASDVEDPSWVIQNIEVLSLGATASSADHVVDVAKLGGMDTVVTEGVSAGPFPATAATFTVVVTAPAVGADTITFDGVIVTLADGDTAEAIAAKIEAAINADIGGSVNWTASAFGANVTFTASDTNLGVLDIADVEALFSVFDTLTGVGKPGLADQDADVEGAQEIVVATQGANAVPGVKETFTTTFSYTAGDAGKVITFDGFTYTIVAPSNGGNADAKLASAFVDAYNAWAVANNETWVLTVGTGESRL